jgi:hypothetical protein
MAALSYALHRLEGGVARRERQPAAELANQLEQADVSRQQGLPALFQLVAEDVEALLRSP